MFQVKDRSTGKVYTVYSISRQKKQEFLIYRPESSGEKWVWVDAEKYDPLFTIHN